jgi:hypothetical protein
MWWTPSGERALQGPEWELFREGLDVSWDWVEESMNDPDLFPFDVEAFDSLQPTQRLALLALVGNALKDESLPHPELNAHTEATVAAIFSCIATQVAMEIDLKSEEDPPEVRTLTRKLVLAAFAQATDQDAAELQNVSYETSDARSRRLPPPVEGEEDDDTEAWIAPAADSDDMDKWMYLLDYLANRILWEDGDYEIGDAFMDADPGESRLKMEMLGIADDYYTAIAPDPLEEELVSIRQQLRTLCNRPEAKDCRH